MLIIDYYAISYVNTSPIAPKGRAISDVISIFFIFNFVI